jgi:parvulin-like peptidyl-prolyl isomerase
MNQRKHRSLRLVAVVAAAVAVAMAASGCSSTLSDAATVGGTHISNREFQRELSDLANNKSFVSTFEKAGLKVGASENTVASSFSTIWLNQRVRQAAIDAELAQRKITVTASDRTKGAANAADFFDPQAANDPNAANGTAAGKKVLAAFPKTFQTAIIDRQARTVALEAGIVPTVADAQTFYDTNKAQLFPCSSGKTVAHIVLATQDAAAAALALVQSGTDFGTVAQQLSSDTATKQTGGVISDSQGVAGCYPGSQDQAFSTAVSGATTGTPTAPVKTAAGWEIILVTDYTPPTFEQIKSTLQSELRGSGVLLSQVITERLRKEHVTVAPQYGTWVVNAQGAAVQAPTAPSPRSTRHPTTTTTAPAGLGTSNGG